MDIGAQHRIRRRLLSVGHLVGLFLAMSFICLPGFWVVLNSFRPTVEIMAKPPVWIPSELNLDNYRRFAFLSIAAIGLIVMTAVHAALEGPKWGITLLGTAAIGGLDVQLVYFRGLAECRASRWVSDARQLAALMEKIDCRGGHSQIGRVLASSIQKRSWTQHQSMIDARAPAGRLY